MEISSDGFNAKAKRNSDIKNKTFSSVSTRKTNNSSRTQALIAAAAAPSNILEKQLLSPSSTPTEDAILKKTIINKNNLNKSSTANTNNKNKNLHLENILPPIELKNLHESEIYVHVISDDDNENDNDDSLSVDAGDVADNLLDESTNGSSQVNNETLKTIINQSETNFVGSSPFSLAEARIIAKSYTEKLEIAYLTNQMNRFVSSERKLHETQNDYNKTENDNNSLDQQRQQMLKYLGITNTDTLEKHLNNLERKFTKLSSLDKVNGWNYSSEVSDVEDVINFEQRRKQLEQQYQRAATTTNNLTTNLSESLSIQPIKIAEFQLEELTAKAIKTNNKKTEKLKNTKLKRQNQQKIVQKNSNNLKANSNLTASKGKSKILKKRQNRVKKVFSKIQKTSDINNLDISKEIDNNQIIICSSNAVKSNQFKIPNIPKKYLPGTKVNTSLDVSEKKEEFYKYLGLGTKAECDKIDNCLELKRRSLRVKRIQNKQKEMNSNISRSKSVDDISNSNHLEGESKRLITQFTSPQHNKITEELNKLPLKRKLFETAHESEKQSEIAKIKIICSTNSNLPTKNNSLSCKNSRLNVNKDIDTVIEFPTHNQNSTINISKSSTNLIDEKNIITSSSFINVKSVHQLNDGSTGRVSCASCSLSSKISTSGSISDEKELPLPKSSHPKPQSRKESLILYKSTYDTTSFTTSENKLSPKKIVKNLSQSHSLEKEQDNSIKDLKINYTKPVMIENSNSSAIQKPNSILENNKNSKNEQKIKIEFSKNYSNKEVNSIKKKNLDKVFVEKSSQTVQETEEKQFLKKEIISTSENLNSDEDLSTNNEELVNNNEHKNNFNSMVKAHDGDGVYHSNHKRSPNRRVLPRTKKLKIHCKRQSKINKKFLKLLVKKPGKLVKKKPIPRRQRLITNSDKSVNLCTTADACNDETEENINLIKSENKIKKECIDRRISVGDKLNVYENQQSIHMINPLKFESGDVIHAYYENDILIILQEFSISFWKNSKILKIMGREQEWQLMGECKRKLNDNDVISPFKNRICMNEGNPVYVELRARQLDTDLSRECNLSSVYANIYYYDRKEKVAHQRSIQLDTMKCLSSNIIYTTINNSRYFLVCWKQDTALNKSRSGLCKYALTPDLETLASIREIKHLRHYVYSLECIEEDKLIGFGDSQITIWDHRTGDVLMNFDLGISVGKNLGSLMHLYEGENYLFIYQLHANLDDKMPELKLYAITLTNSPTYRLLHRHELPLQFDNIKSNLLFMDLYLIVTSITDEEFWLFIDDPKRIFNVNDEYSTSCKRFYSTKSDKFVEITGDYLNVKPIQENFLKFLT